MALETKPRSTLVGITIESHCPKCIDPHTDAKMCHEVKVDLNYEGFAGVFRF